MTDTEFEAQKQRVLDLANFWNPILGLDRWHLRYKFERTTNQAGSGATTMSCGVDWRYLDATLTVYTPELEAIPDDELAVIYVHECVHMLLDELTFDLKRKADTEERVATVLAMAFVRLRDTLTEPEQQAA